MDELKKVDEVAYVRFASVYRQFTDVNTFIKEIEKLVGNKNNEDMRKRAEQSDDKRRKPQSDDLVDAEENNY